MPRMCLPLAVLLAAGLADAASAAPRPQQSWGKAGVSFEDYRKDAVECGRSAYYADVSQTEQAQAFVRGTRQLESTDGMPLDMLELARRYGQIQQSVRPERRIRELREGLQQVLEICLTKRGYSRFALTDEQRRKLGRLKKGSPERHRFLHSLASNPQVLRMQETADG